MSALLDLCLSAFCCRSRTHSPKVYPVYQPKAQFRAALKVTDLLLSEHTFISIGRVAKEWETKTLSMLKAHQ